MEYFTTTSKASNRPADFVIVGVYDRGKLGTAAADIDSASHGEIRRRIKSGDIASKPGTCAVLTNVPGIKADRVAVVGLGKPSVLSATVYRKALTTALQAVAKTRAKNVLNALTLEPVNGTDIYYLARHTAEGVGPSFSRRWRERRGCAACCCPS